MANDWILDVLTDLRSFACKNGLTATEMQMVKAIGIVAEELTSVQGMAPGTPLNIGHTGELHRQAGFGRKF